VPKAYPTAVRYQRYSRKRLNSKWESYLRQDIQSIAREDWLHGLTAANGTKAQKRSIMSAFFHHAIRYGFPARDQDLSPIKCVRKGAVRDLIPGILAKNRGGRDHHVEIPPIVTPTCRIDTRTGFQVH